MKVKALVAGVLLALGTSGANAAIVAGNLAGTTGELFLNATDGTNTFSYDTGLTVNALLAKTPAEVAALSWDFSGDANWASFAGNSSVKWNFAGANTGVGISTATLGTWGFVTTVQGGSAAVLSSAFGVSGYGNLTGKLASQAGNINQSLNNFVGSDNLSGFHAAGTPADYANYGGNFQGGFGANSNEFSVGDYASFAWFGRDKVSSFGVKMTAKDFFDASGAPLFVHLDTAGKLSFATAPAAVPVPGAIWMMGSALVGLIGFRRRSA